MEINKEKKNHILYLNSFIHLFIISTYKTLQFTKTHKTCGMITISLSLVQIIYILLKKICYNI